MTMMARPARWGFSAILKTLGALVFLTPSQATRPHQGWTLKSYPNPTSNVGNLRALCGSHITFRDSSSFICDPDAILTRHGAMRVHKELDRIRAEIKGPCGTSGKEQGYQVAVALAYKVQTPATSYPDLDYATEIFAKQLHDTWGVGDAACNNGALLFLSKQDRTVYISRGNGLTHLLTDSRLDTIIHRMVDKLRAEDYDDAVLSAVTAVGQYLKMGPPGWWEENFGWVLLVGMVLVLVSFALLSHFNDRKRKKDYDECMRKLQGIERERNRLRANQLAPALSCPICLEDFTDRPPATTTSSQRPAPDTETAEATANDETETLMVDEAARSNGNGRERYGCDGKPVEYLPCGHIFCHSCLGEWLRSHDKCPICRAPITPPGGVTSPPPPRGPCSDTATDTHTGEATLERRRSGRVQLPPQDITAELLFRLMMAQRRYPNLISQPMVDRWANPDYQGTYTTDRAFTRLDPRASVTNNNNGFASSSPSSWGASSRSFGGGSSGGGRGGRW